jgi:4-hydroxythreonine-4-phosphate dehydrogenase
MSLTPALPAAVTMGDPVGIGGDITLMCWSERQNLKLKPFFVIDDPARLKVLAEKLGLPVVVEVISNPEDAIALFDRALPVLPLSDQITESNFAGLVVESLDRAVDFAIRGEVASVVTNPIHKARLYDAGFKHPGHTEYLAARAEMKTGDQCRPVMMLACEEIRVVPITIHTSLRQAIDDLTTDLIVETAEICAHNLGERFGLAAPRLAFAGLNPHAGEDGNMGKEEIEIIRPAIEILQSRGINCLGPLSADTMFHATARLAYDVALCMYHDQALIPIKTIDFEHGVNVTLGLPFIRTSPDHGTAFGLSGTGNANPNSLAAALMMASDMATQSNV